MGCVVNPVGRWVGKAFLFFDRSLLVFLWIG